MTSCQIMFIRKGDVLKVTFLLPMKDKSERVFDKNIRDFHGKPLFEYILNAILKSEYIEKVIIDTDSDRIISVVNSDYGKNDRICIIKRDKRLLGAKMPMTPIIKYDLQFCDTDFFMQMHATTPLLKTETIDNAIRAFKKGIRDGYDSLIGVNSYQTRFYFKDGRPVNHDPDVMVPSQDMPYIYEDNSCFYINSKDNFYKNNNRVGKRPIFFPVPKLEAIDIDDMEDLVLAEAVYFYQYIYNRESIK